MSDIVEELEAWIRPAGTNIDYPCIRKARDEIKWLRMRNSKHEARYEALEAMVDHYKAENEALRAEVDRLTVRNKRFDEYRGKAVEQILTLEAEVERLRGTLERRKE